MFLHWPCLILTSRRPLLLLLFESQSNYSSYCALTPFYKGHFLFKSTGLRKLIVIQTRLKLPGFRFNHKCLHKESSLTFWKYVLLWYTIIFDSICTDVPVKSRPVCSSVSFQFYLMSSNILRPFGLFLFLLTFVIHLCLQYLLSFILDFFCASSLVEKTKIFPFSISQMGLNHDDPQIW